MDNKIIESIAWQKMDNLVPAIIQSAIDNSVLMLGYMSKESLEKTLEIGKVTFYSRSKKRLWTKGEESGHFLELKDITVDCDNDSILIKAIPYGPTCHTGSKSCFTKNEENSSLYIIDKLEKLIAERKDYLPENSYLTSLFKKGLPRIAQKVGEEGVEVVIAAMKQDSEDELISETADLLFHLLVLLREKGISLEQICQKLVSRNTSN
ncbi:bifunctional phosphoribosyl-AMP cyclohydrolase/phosphoribosyl-ATP diphosphatase HisIE [Francisella philomiragia]|uniref:bifunctional phosphoribosyl-AMP cyclohydrolase/phosphoribosyl-ATP diphosphatase HisIE n=1 Tax=Francisella philomiragia TaxID=28110 RepID=UPI001905625D|nr:bifunctional phosphoribosyl-AMP cyclohydrolase/phosphoribosyl-ATP diphosphatase HisIE [Francisella philomiragia]MBK2255891.1 bifunctional phosphoribosyl-AMP cyclohydrolase/phosphoribosyl-ATP diphosphatase HisIE [Francisella philomiragia]MBK2268549.1 bifunctional phosphoribosyl-AMP cyclohydrolase/phosphoribosyl-ATP diphosphatase HisIE [Francisella philomiragia]MBK2270976.1 bifunctional phosphoribosyl-AMP cyclohydrolase/phosphoribosyl-ATP diphosphatase HisIE [Francisella philomiragia]MBK227475